VPLCQAQVAAVAKSLDGKHHDSESGAAPRTPAASTATLPLPALQSPDAAMADEEATFGAGRAGGSCSGPSELRGEGTAMAWGCVDVGGGEGGGTEELARRLTQAARAARRESEAFEERIREAQRMLETTR